jgi:hypothetical protein
MFSQQHIRPALLSTLAVLLLLLAGAGVPGVSVSQATTSSGGGSPGLAALPSCSKSTPPVAAFNASNFPANPKLDNPLYPLAPGTQLILEGFVNSGTTHVEHRIVTIVTDLTKTIDGVPTVVLWDRDFSPNLQGQLEVTESELAFHAQDTAGNPWNLGEYPATYTGGTFSGAPDTWIAGLPTAQGQPAAKAGNILPGQPQVGTPSFLQAFAAPDIILDCGQVSKTGQHICNTIGCYDNVVIIEEVSPPDPGSQLKYYAPGVGNFQVDPRSGDPTGETLVLSETVHLSRAECLAARQAVLALEDQAYNHDTSQSAYKLTHTTSGYSDMVSTGFCETIQAPSPTPSVSPTATQPTPTPPTPTPGGVPEDRNLYLPTTIKNFAAQIPPPAIYDGCKSNPNPASAPNFPVQIVGVDKVAELVTLKNVSNTIISLEDWNMCSLGTHQDHDQIFGSIAPGQTRTFPNTGGSPVWNDNTRNDGALYNAAGYMVSYWVDQ